MRRDRDRLLDIVEAIDRIKPYAERGRSAFDSNELIQTYLVHHEQIIGEAARAISDGLKDAHPEVPWRRIEGMRRVIVHDYWQVELDIVWETAVADLPELKERVEAVLAELPD